MKNATGTKEKKKNKLSFKEKATAKLLYPIINKIIDSSYNVAKYYIELNCENSIISKMPTPEEFAENILNELKGEENGK